MWWGLAGAACGVLGALLVLCALQRHRKPAAPRGDTFTVEIVRGSLPFRAASVPRPPPRPFTHARVFLPLLTAPPPDPNKPHILAQPAKTPPPSTSAEHKVIPKLPFPEQCIYKRPFDYKYTSIPHPLVQIAADLGSDLNPENRPKKFSVTRSPSLEKDEKSPFLVSAKSEKSDVFGFDTDNIKTLTQTSPVMTEKSLSPKVLDERDESPGTLRRFRSVSTRLNICSVSETPHLEGHQERSEMQNSPRVLECSSAKEKTSAPRFDFSPRLLADSLTSPRFFTPPEMVSPMFFAEPSPKSVYYDTVRSPKFFPETPRDSDVPQSPRTLGDNFNRSNGLSDKPSSPKVLSAKPSPKVYSCNKENYFTFDVSSAEDGAKCSSKPRRYGGRNSIEKERYTPPADKEAKKYKRHNSCDTNNFRNVELNITKTDDSKKETTIEDKDVVDCCAKMNSLHVETSHSISANVRRQRLKSISLDSDNAKMIEQNLGLPIAKQIKDQMNAAYKNEASTSCESLEKFPETPTNEQPPFQYEEEKDKTSEEEEPKSPDLKQKKGLRHSSGTQTFIDMPRFSPKEFEILVTTEEGAITTAESHVKRKGKNLNLRNLTIDLNKRDSDLEKELLEFEKLYSHAEEKKVKTPTLKIKAISLDSSESVNLSLPQKQTLDVPQNSISVPNTPKRQLKRILMQKHKQEYYGGKQSSEQRRLYMKGQDSGIFLRENHAVLMLYQPGTSRMGSRKMGSFDENMAEFAENAPEINISGVENKYQIDSGQTLGTNLFKPNLSVSSTNLKTLPEGVPSDDFEPSAEDEKVVKKLYRRNSNQSLMLSSSLQSSNCSLSSAGASCHNISTVRTSFSNFSLSSESRQNKLSLERRDSNTTINPEHLTPKTKVICSSNTNVTGEVSKNCLLQRRGSNNSLTLNIHSSNNLSRHSSNSSLNKEAILAQKKGLLERRSSNTSLTLNINNSNPQLAGNRSLSISNYNLNGSTCNLSRYNSNHSIDNPTTEPRKGILERRSSNTSLTLNIQPQEPREVEIDENLIDSNLKELPHKDKHRKSLSTENLIPKSYKNRTRLRSTDKSVGFGSHDNLWSASYTEQQYPQNLTYVCGDQDNEIIYAFGTHEEASYQPGFVRNITTKPLSPQSTSEDFRLYLANMQHLQNASSVLSRQQLKDFYNVFQNGYSNVKCHEESNGPHCCVGRVDTDAKVNPQTVLPDPEPSQPCSEYQKMLLRNLHQEFWDMPTNFQEKPIVSGSHTKNRYKTILPNEHSRVIVRDEGVGEAYVNANFIKGHEYAKNSYIATQGPLPNTIYDFWLMVHQNRTKFSQNSDGAQHIQKVVMLTNFIENNRQKCEQYFPLELNKEKLYPNLENNGEFNSSFNIKNCGVITKSGYTIRKLEVVYHKGYNNSEMSMVYHYWFHNWADHKCPKDVNSLLNLSLDVLKDSVLDFDSSSEVKEETCQCESSKSDSKFVFPPLDTQSAPCEVNVNLSSPFDFSTEINSPPVIIHCSAGIGRTGCFIAILNGIKQLTNEQKVDVLGIVCNMRLNRGGMVQNSEQYELIYKVLCVYEQACLPS